MRQIQSTSKSAMPSPFAYPQKPPYKTAHSRAKTLRHKIGKLSKSSSHYLRLDKANCDIQIWRSSLKARRRSRFQNLARKDVLSGASGDIKFNELNRAGANALG